MGCVFCATGQAGFERNLTTGEIIAQVIGVRPRAGRPRAASRSRTSSSWAWASRWRTTARSGRPIETLNAADGIGMAARHITISTVGLIPGIRQLADEPLQVGLAVSLHAPDEALRERLIPTAHRYPLAGDHRRLPRVRREDGPPRHVRVLPDGRRQRRAGAGARARRSCSHGMLCHVNLIPVNPTPDGRIRRPSRDAGRSAFQRELAARGIAVHRPRRKGRGDQRCLRPARAARSLSSSCPRPPPPETRRRTNSTQHDASLPDRVVDAPRRDGSA